MFLDYNDQILLHSNYLYVFEIRKYFKLTLVNSLINLQTIRVTCEFQTDSNISITPSSSYSD